MPAVIGQRGPIRWASAPAREESSSISRVTGSSAAPAAIGEKPADELQLQREQEEDSAERGVDDQRSPR